MYAKNVRLRVHSGLDSSPDRNFGMASYITQILIDGEQLIYQARLSIWSQATLVLIGVVLIPAFGFGLHIMYENAAALAGGF